MGCSSKKMLLLQNRRIKRYPLFLVFKYNFILVVYEDRHILQCPLQVNDFYVHANEHHQFISWMKHYLAVSSGNPKLVPSLQQQATAFGVDVASLLQDRCLRNSTSESGSRSGNNASYGYLCVSRFEFHIFSHVLVHTFGEGLVRTTMRSSSIFSAFLFFEKSVRLLVHETLIGRAQATLVDSWARFIEFYILPGSALMQHTVGKIADPAKFVKTTLVFFDTASICDV